MRRLRVATIVTLLLGSVAAASAEPLNIIFYGNSFTLGFGSTRSVNAVFTDIATAAGHDTPYVQSAAASGQDLGWHLQNNIGPIFLNIPLDEDWDYIVMQEHSTKLTDAWGGGQPAGINASKADATGLYQTAASRSANVRPVLYQTWARGPGHDFYTGANPIFTGPSEMQAQLRSGYEELRTTLNTAMGADLAKVGRAGDAWETANYDNLHAPDLWHAQNRGTLLSSLMIYAAIYDDNTVSDIDLTGVLASLGLTANDGAFLTQAADQTLVPEPSSAALVCLLAAAAGVRRRGRLMS